MWGRGRPLALGASPRTFESCHSDVKEIYTLLEPETRKIRYVGLARSAKERVKSHWRQRNSTYRSPVKEWLCSLSAPPPYEILQVVEDEVGIQAEEYWTTLLRQIDTVDLLNRRDGYRHHPENRAKISEASKGHHVSLEMREKLSQALTGKHPSEETRRRMSAGRKGRPISAQGLKNVKNGSICRECRKRIIRKLGQ